MTNATLRGKPDAGNPHVRFDEGEVALVKPRRGPLLYRKLQLTFGLSVAMAAVAVMPLAANATPVDGEFWLDASWLAVNWSSPRWWTNTKVAGGGGQAKFLGTMNTLNIDVTGVQLNRLDLNKLDSSKSNVNALIGSDITFVGSAFLSGVATGTGTGIGFDLRATLKGTGANSFGKIGTGIFNVTKPFSNFGHVDMWLGTLNTTNASGTIITSSPLWLTGGKIRWSPNVPTDTACSATLGSSVTQKPGVGLIELVKGNASTQTLTLPSLPVSSTGTLVFVASDLGNTQKIKVSGTAPTMRSGLVDPSFFVV